MAASVLFIVHCTSGSASAISDSMRASSAGTSSPSGLFATRSGGEVPSGAGRPAVVRGHPVLAKSLFVGVLPDDIGDEPVRHAHKGDGPHHPIHLLGRQLLGLDQERCQELGVNVPGLPEGQGQRMVRA